MSNVASFVVFLEVVFIYGAPQCLKDRCNALGKCLLLTRLTISPPECELPTVNLSQMR
jgi:hypothetical protein